MVTSIAILCHIISSCPTRGTLFLPRLPFSQAVTPSCSVGMMNDITLKWALNVRDQGILLSKGTKLYNSVSPENWCQYPCDCVVHKESKT